jgi:16S rRNA (uracil1498-N3)-methyltransferase
MFRPHIERSLPMPRFFAAIPLGEEYTITGPDAAHIARSLRMRPGEELTVCDAERYDCRCAVVRCSPEAVDLRVLERIPNHSEPEIRATLYQALPKAEKMDWIVQKAVELGVYAVVPVITMRCVSRPEAKALHKKQERWQKIAEEAAKQSGRGRIPEVRTALQFSEALHRAREDAAALLFYEGGGESIGCLLSPGCRTASLLIGPEGGFDPSEVALAREAGVSAASLGPRILRTETAPLAALTALMYATGNLQ